MAQKTRKRTAKQADQVRIPAIGGYYARRVVPALLETMEFRTLLVPRTGSPRLIDSLAESVEWTDDNAVLQGQIMLRRPQFRRGPYLGHGNLIRLDVKWGRSWREAWNMRIWSQEEDLIEDQLTCPLFDDMVILQRSRDDFRFVKNRKTRPQGWYAHEILVEVARRYKIPLGRIARGTVRIKNMDLENVSPLDAITRAYRLEREGSGRRFYMRWRGGRLHVVPLQRNDTMYVLRNAFLSAQLSSEVTDNFATALTARATLPKNRSKRSEKVSVNVQRNVSKFGFIHRQIRVDGVDSRRDVEQQARRRLARLNTVRQGVTITHPGIPWIYRGDAVEIELPERGLTGDRAIMWCSAITHNLDSSGYVISPTLILEDPLRNPEKVRSERDKRTRRAKRERNKSATVGGATAP